MFTALPLKISTVELIHTYLLFLSSTNLILFSLAIRLVDDVNAVVHNLPMNQMLDINLRPFEPLSCIDRVPQKRQEHGAAVNEARVIHVQCVEVFPLKGGEAENRQHE